MGITGYVVSTHELTHIRDPTGICDIICIICTRFMHIIHWCADIRAAIAAEAAVGEDLSDLHLVCAALLRRVIAAVAVAEAILLLVVIREVDCEVRGGAILRCSGGDGAAKICYGLNCDY